MKSTFVGVRDVAIYEAKYLFIKKNITHIEVNSNDNFSFNSLEFFYIEEGNANFVSINNCLIDVNKNKIILGTKYSNVPTSPKITTVGCYAFNNVQFFNNLHGNLVIPSNIKTIEKYAFNNCNLTSVYLSCGVEKIELNAFSNNPIQDFYISSTVKQIIVNFENNKSNNFKLTIKNIQVDKGNPYFECVNNCLIERKTKTVIFACENATIPNYTGVEAIGKEAFANLTIKSIILPNNIKFIDKLAFCGCQLESITLPANLKTIGDMAFANNNLTCLEIPNSIETIGKGIVFSNSRLKAIYLPNSAVYYVESGCLIERKTQSLVSCFGNVINIPLGIKTILENAFSYLLNDSNTQEKLKIYIPKTVESIEKGCFTCVKFVVENNTFAHRFAKRNNIEYEVKF